MNQTPRGTKDIFGEELRKRNLLVQHLSEWAEKQAFVQFESPTFEYSSLFTNSDGEEKNILERELFFLEGKKYALKPEGTAPLARAIIGNKLILNSLLPLKFFYITKCFRHERPQHQRLREFSQFGVEIIHAHSTIYELELIYMLDTFFREKLKLELKLRINYLSKSESRKKWAEELKKYFRERRETLGSESREKIESNPIRILDTEQNLEIIRQAPKISNFFNYEEKKRKIELQKTLDRMGVKYSWDENLVRGLDYYTGVVFEWSFNELGIAGGGRYDELFNHLSVNRPHLKNIPSLGLAIGLERLQNVLEQNNYHWTRKIDRKIYFCALIEQLDPKILKLIGTLRESGFDVESNWDLKDLKAHFKRSERAGIRWLLIFGEQESRKNEIILKEQNRNFSLTFSLENEKGLIEELTRVIEYEI